MNKEDFDRFYCGVVLRNKNQFKRAGYRMTDVKTLAYWALDTMGAEESRRFICKILNEEASPRRPICSQIEGKTDKNGDDLTSLQDSIEKPFCQYRAEKYTHAPIIATETEAAFLMKLAAAYDRAAFRLGSKATFKTTYLISGSFVGLHGGTPQGEQLARRIIKEELKNEFPEIDINDLYKKIPKSARGSQDAEELKERLTRYVERKHNKLVNIDILIREFSETVREPLNDLIDQKFLTYENGYIYFVKNYARENEKLSFDCLEARKRIFDEKHKLTKTFKREERKRVKQAETERVKQAEAERAEAERAAELEKARREKEELEELFLKAVFYSI